MTLVTFQIKWEFFFKLHMRCHINAKTRRENYRHQHHTYIYIAIVSLCLPTAEADPRRVRSLHQFDSSANDIQILADRRQVRNIMHRRCIKNKY